MMRRLLWIGDAGCQSGFARATHYTLEALRKTWDVAVLGLNYRGDPHTYPYPIYPAYVPGGDLFGVSRIRELMGKLRPEMIVLQNDPWNIPAYLKKIDGHARTVGAIAVDGRNCRGKMINGLDRVIFWTHFAQEEAIRGGFTRPSGIVNLGVDLDIYKPGDARAARKRALGLPERCLDAFIVGNVNRNQPRKRLDLTIEYFADWYKSRPTPPNAYLYLHVAPTGDLGYDCEQLALYHGVADRLVLAEPEVFHGASEEELAATYHAFDVQISTTQGEGWGLTTLEGMACGIPQLIPDWAALGEWARDAASMVACSSRCVTPNGINAVGGIADKATMIASLDALYSSPALRQEYREKGIAKAAEPQFRWAGIADRFAEQVEFAVR